MVADGRSPVEQAEAGRRAFLSAFLLSSRAYIWAASLASLSGSRLTVSEQGCFLPRDRAFETDEKND